MSKYYIFSLSSLLMLYIEEISSTNNLAYNKPTAQSGADYRLGGVANLAVDNNLTTCAYVYKDATGPPVWWQVDLQFECYITSVTIQFPFDDDSQYMQGFVIIVSDNNSTNITPSSSTPLCYTFSNGSDTGSGDTVTLRGLRPTFTCNQPLIGRYVTIRRQGGYQTRFMSFCDVQINGACAADRAHEQPATQSNATIKGNKAAFAVDGNMSTCSATDTGNITISAWWQVDLQGIYSVNFISIFFSTEGGLYLFNEGFNVYVSNSTQTDSFLPHERCFGYSSTDDPYISAYYNLTLYQEIFGRYVTIKPDNEGGPREQNTLTFCEVYIYSRYSTPGFYSNLLNSTPVEQSAILTGNTLTIIVGAILGFFLIVSTTINITLIVQNVRIREKKVNSPNEVIKDCNHGNLPTEEQLSTYMNLGLAIRREDATPYEELHIAN